MLFGIPTGTKPNCLRMSSIADRATSSFNMIIITNVGNPTLYDRLIARSVARNILDRENFTFDRSTQRFVTRNLRQCCRYEIRRWHLRLYLQSIGDDTTEMLN
jgi:hypothetical protein